MRRPRFAWCLLWVASCGGSTEPPPPSARGIQFVSGAAVTDSIGAILAQPLLVEVRDTSGRLAPVGTLVQFAGVQPGHLIVFEAHVRVPGAQEFEPVATGTTDANGRASVQVRLGFVAGPARIAVSAPALGVSDTAAYTVIPGAAHDVRLAPLDTTIYVGRSYALRGGVVDRAGNLRADPLTWSSSGTGLSVSNTGVVSAGAFGHYSVFARRTPNNATGVNVSVVPQARIAGSLDMRIVGIDIDGANLRDLSPVAVPVVWTGPRWIPQSATLVYTHQDGLIPVLFVTDENRVSKRFLTNPPPTLTRHAEPAPSANGEWVYFSGLDSRCSSVHPCLYRSRADGTAAELLGNPRDFPGGARQPSPSPDGTKVAFVDSTGAASVIKVFDVASQTVSLWNVAGRYPAWSPTGTHIAFTPNGGGPFMIMNADGTGIRALSTLVFAEEPLNWSADGRWLISRMDLHGVLLLHVTSGDVIPVRLLAGRLATPSFK